MADNINDDVAITANATHSWTPPRASTRAREYLVTLEVASGTATLNVNQRTVKFTGFNAIGLTTAGKREVIVASHGQPVNFVISSVSSFSGKIWVERVGVPTA